MTADKRYCMSSYLMFRTIADHERSFSTAIRPVFYDGRFQRTPVHSSLELEASLRRSVQRAAEGGKAALALSGGIDSAILARYMPRGSVGYTFKCVVPGIQVVDETPQAARYAEACGLEHRVVEIRWEDFARYAPRLMKRKGAPLHSIEIQICKAAEQAVSDGFTTLIFGESADVNYGGFNGLLSRDWSLEKFAARYSHVDPAAVLRQPVEVLEPYRQYERGGVVDVHEFVRHVFYTESMGSYTNACDCAGISFSAPFAETYMAEPLDLARVRAGENKYWVREIFHRLYPDFQIPAKIPMPRPMNEWMKDWPGPVRPEFLPHCAEGMTGDQKWMIFCLEQFLNLMDEES